MTFALPIAHLSISVTARERTRAFFVDRLGATVGRTAESWLDLWVFGMQLTIHQAPERLPAGPSIEGLHLGATVPMALWEDLARQFSADDPAVVSGPSRDTAKGVAKLILRDPDGYLIELKAYDGDRVPETPR